MVKVEHDFGGLGTNMELDRLQVGVENMIVFDNPSYKKYLEDRDPSGKDLKEPGTKGDSGKAPVFRGLLDYFPRACEVVAGVSEIGARKYSWKGWETVPDGISRYSDALVRHLTAESIQGRYDRDTGALHAAQVAWNALARLELILRKEEQNAGL